MRVSLLVIFSGVLAFLASCENVKGPFRTASEAELCAAPHAFGAANWEVGKAHAKAAHQRCSLQTHMLPEKRRLIELVLGEMALSGHDWAELAISAEREIATPGQYHLAFVELEANGDLAVDGQLEALKAHLNDPDQSRQDFVVTFVHGWRHDAALRNTDVKKFRRLLAYSRAALNTRCIADGRYCSARLTGVFVGWPGRSFNEGEVPDDVDIDGDGGFSLGFLGAALQFWRRWDISCYLGTGEASCLKRSGVKSRLSPLHELLKGVQSELKLRQGSAAADKMLIFGHSMGGNMLARMMHNIVPGEISNHIAGQVMPPPLGDLVVLLNPAAEAASWVKLQQIERKRGGFNADENTLTCEQGKACPERAKLVRWRRLYPIQQRPVYISLTSASDWGTLKDAGRTVEFDSATAKVFPFARAFGGYDSKRNAVAIGHYLPRYRTNTTLDGPATGTTHEVVVLNGNFTAKGAGAGGPHRSTYGNAAHPARAWCAPTHGWLRAARTPANPAHLPKHNWDYGLRSQTDENTEKFLRNLGAPLNKTSIQWRQGLYTKDNRNALSVAPGTTPFWNVRALDTVIRGHAGWANYPIWCALNQMVLDDITAAPN